MFEKMGCDRSVIEDMLGSSSSIRDSDIITYLGLVEQKTSELLTIQSYLMSKVPNREPSLPAAPQEVSGESPRVYTHIALHKAILVLKESFSDVASNLSGLGMLLVRSRAIAHVNQVMHLHFCYTIISYQDQQQI